MGSLSYLSALDQLSICLHRLARPGRLAWMSGLLEVSAVRASDPL